MTISRPSSRLFDHRRQGRLTVSNELRLPFVSVAHLAEDEAPLPDEVHMQEGAHAKIGTFEGEAIIQAVLALRR